MKEIRYTSGRHTAACALLALLAYSIPAFAHPGAFAHGNGFVAGFIHPLTGIDHLLAMFAIGLWSSRQTALLQRLTPAVVALAMASGAILAWAGMPFFRVEFGIAFSVLLAGVFLCSLVRLPTLVGATAIFALLLLHGHAHGSELAFGIAGMAGFMISSALIATIGSVLGARVFPWRPQLLRLAGAVVTVCGAGLLLGG